MPAFAFRHVKDLYPVFWRKARESVATMVRQIELDAATAVVEPGAEKRAATATAEMEANKWASRATLDIIGVAGMGRDFGAVQDPDNHLAKTYAAVFAPNRGAQILEFISIMFGERLMSMLPMKRNFQIAEARKVIRATCRDLIRDKKEKLARKEPTEVDILSVALESGGFSDENLVDQLMTFLAAGHETTASAMTWAVYQLCRNPDMQARLRAEVREHLPAVSDADARDISSLDIDRMPYLNAFCSEVLRYNSPVSLTVRRAAVDTTIQGHPIPEGARIILASWAINRSEAFWGPDAGQFNPDRWVPKFDGDRSAAAGGATSNYAFMTFLHGPRSCIGMAFARAEFAILLAAWVGRLDFRFRDPEDADEENLKIRGGITTKPEKGMHVYATVVDGW